jgi:hypothetical protein
MASIEGQTSKQGQAPLQNYNEDAEQLATLAEGKVADAVKKTSTRDQPRKDDIKIEDYASDLDRFVCLGNCDGGSKLIPWTGKRRSRLRLEKKSNLRGKQALMLTEVLVRAG